jgi:hypothetical protein
VVAPATHSLIDCSSCRTSPRTPARHGSTRRRRR